MESIISTFHIDWKIIIAQALNFGIVFAVLYVFAMKPLGKLMDERSEKIKKGINDAKSNAEILAKTEAEYAEALARAKAEANKIFQEGKKEAEAKRNEMLEQAKNEVAGVIENGRKVLEAEKSKMVEEAKKEIVELTLRATEKILGEKAGDNFNGKVIKDLNNI